MTEEKKFSDQLKELSELAELLSRLTGKKITYHKVYHHLYDTEKPMEKRGKRLYARLSDLMDMELAVSVHFLSELYSSGVEQGRKVSTEASEEIKQTEDDTARKLIDQALNREEKHEEAEH